MSQKFFPKKQPAQELTSRTVTAGNPEATPPKASAAGEIIRTINEDYKLNGVLDMPLRNLEKSSNVSAEVIYAKLTQCAEELMKDPKFGETEAGKVYLSLKDVLTEEPKNVLEKAFSNELKAQLIGNAKIKELLKSEEDYKSEGGYAALLENDLQSTLEKALWLSLTAKENLGPKIARAPRLLADVIGFFEQLKKLPKEEQAVLLKPEKFLKNDGDFNKKLTYNLSGKAMEEAAGVLNDLVNNTNEGIEKLQAFLEKAGAESLLSAIFQKNAEVSAVRSELERHKAQGLDLTNEPFVEAVVLALSQKYDGLMGRFNEEVLPKLSNQQKSVLSGQLLEAAAKTVLQNVDSLLRSGLAYTDRPEAKSNEVLQDLFMLQLKTNYPEQLQMLQDSSKLKTPISVQSRGNTAFLLVHYDPKKAPLVKKLFERPSSNKHEEPQAALKKLGEDIGKLTDEQAPLAKRLRQTLENTKMQELKDQIAEIQEKIDRKTKLQNALELKLKFNDQLFNDQLKKLGKEIRDLTMEQASPTRIANKIEEQKALIIERSKIANAPDDIAKDEQKTASEAERLRIQTTYVAPMVAALKAGKTNEALAISVKITDPAERQRVQAGLWEAMDKADNPVIAKQLYELGR